MRRNAEAASVKADKKAGNEKMITQELQEFNINNYMDVVDPDRAEDISRYYFRGVACLDDLDESLKAALIWELKSVERDEETSSEIMWLYDTDSEYLEYALEEYSKRVLEEDVCRSFFELADTGDSEEKLLSLSGFELLPVESRDLRIPLSELREVHALRKKAPNYIRSLGSIDNDMFDQGMIKIMFNRNAGSLEDMYYLPKDWFDEKVSCCVMTDGMINGFLLVHRYPSGLMMPVFFSSSGSDSRYNLLEMMRFSAHSALAAYPGDTTVLIRRRNESVRKLTEKLFPGKTGDMVMSGERRER